MGRGWMVAQIEMASHQLERGFMNERCSQIAIDIELSSSRMMRIIARGKSLVPSFPFLSFFFFLQMKVEPRCS